MNITYDIENLTDPVISKKYGGEVTLDVYGRKVPKSSHGTINLDYRTSSTKVLTRKCVELFDKIVDKDLLVRKINITACNLEDESKANNDVVHEQLDLFSNNLSESLENEKEKEQQKDELALQRTLLDIKNKYGKNAILKGMNLEDGATTIDRNSQVGGHKG
jgi:DNA polymerase V